MEANCVEEFARKRKERAEQKRHDKQDMYRKVYKELVSIPLYSGKYDALNTDPEYMYGIESVMESVAYNAGGNELSDEFETMFFNNMEYSEDLAFEKLTDRVIKGSVLLGSVLAAGATLFCVIKKAKGDR